MIDIFFVFLYLYRVETKRHSKPSQVCVYDAPPRRYQWMVKKTQLSFVSYGLSRMYHCSCCRHTVVCKMVRRTIWNALAKVDVDKDVERALEKVPIELRTL